MPFTVLPLDFAVVVVAVDRGVLPGHDLPVATGRTSRPRPGAPIRMTRRHRVPDTAKAREPDARGQKRFGFLAAFVASW